MADETATKSSDDHRMHRARRAHSHEVELAFYSFLGEAGSPPSLLHQVRNVTFFRASSL